MAIKIVIAIGYDNELMKKDIEAIIKIKKFDRNNEYEWSLLYYIPHIPGICFIEKQFRIIEQDCRDKARAVLQHLSQKLDIPLAMRETVTHYNEAILSSIAVMSSVKKMKDVPIILTSNPDKLKFGILDNIIKSIKASKFWQHIVASSRSLDLKTSSW
jgi:hypothetical protein